MTCIEVRVTG